MAGNKADTDLTLLLEQRLSASTDLPVFIHILSDTYNHDDADEKYSNLRWKCEQLYRKRIILVFQKRDNRAVLVIGMSVHEYCRIPNDNSASTLTRSYIQYIDTTGLFKPRHMQTKLTQSLVVSYLEHCERVLKVHSVHLLASAKPSFLFAGSEFNETKGRLSTARLVKWWLNVIDGFLADKKHENVIINVWSPGEDHIEDMRTRERIERRQARNKDNLVTWKYGPLFDDPSGKLVDLVPLFEDDPKLKHFMTFYEDCGFNNLKMSNVQSKTFLETLGLRPEFRNQCHSTFIVLYFPSNENCGVSVAASEKPTQLAAFATKMLNNLTFEEESKAVESSGKIASWLKFMGSKPINVKLLAESHVDKKVQIEENFAKENEPINVQGLIKKQRRD